MPDDSADVSATNEIDSKDTLIGAVFSERYKIIEVIGRGGMGTVYKAHHQLMHKTVALKLLHSHLLDSEISRARFKAEAQAASSLRQANLTSVVDYGLSPTGQPFIVMDYVEGESLSEVLGQSGPLQPKRFFDIFEQVCAGLAYAHSKGIIHRDIKPGNIMLSRSEGDKEVVHIVDFGIAKILTEDADAVQHLTRTGEIFGSPLYMSPEQCRSGNIDGRADVYSLGCVMFEALTGNPPHRGSSAIETLMLHISQRAPLIREACEQFESLKFIEPIVDKSLSIDREKRYQTIEALNDDLVYVRLQKGLPKALQESLPVDSKQTASLSQPLSPRYTQWHQKLARRLNVTNNELAVRIVLICLLFSMLISFLTHFL